MTVMSYIVGTQMGQTQNVFNLLNQISGCEAEISESKDVLVLVTTSESEEDEKRIQKELTKIQQIIHLSMVYAGNDEEIISQNLEMSEEG